MTIFLTGRRENVLDGKRRKSRCKTVPHYTNIDTIMTDREFAYKRLTENEIKSGEFTFKFDYPHTSPLSNFYIYDKNYSGVFGSEYSITDSPGRIVVKVKKGSSNKVFFINDDKVDKEMDIRIGQTYLEIPIEDFLYILSNELWDVADIPSTP